MEMNENHVDHSITGLASNGVLHLENSMWRFAFDWWEKVVESENEFSSRYKVTIGDENGQNYLKYFSRGKKRFTWKRNRSHFLPDTLSFVTSNGAVSTPPTGWPLHDNLLSTQPKWNAARGVKFKWHHDLISDAK